MPKEARAKSTHLRTAIAAAAARLMAADGIDDFALAKRKAARQLGANDTQALPTNEEVEAELRTYLALYQEEEQRERIDALRRVALDAMHALEAYRPYLSGPVLKGTAGRYADIDLQLFTDDVKAVELQLINQGIAYEVSEQRRFSGDEPRAVTVLSLAWDGVPMNVAIHAAKDERTTLKNTPGGRVIERAGPSAVAALLAGADGVDQ
jgi:hypothetical protein